MPASTPTIEPQPPQRQISLRKVMVWIAGVAVVLATLRHGDRPEAGPQAVVGFMLGWFTLCWLILDIMFTLIQLFGGQRHEGSPRDPIDPLPDVDELWVMADGMVIPVEISPWHLLDPEVEPHLETVANRKIGGRVFLCDGSAEPLDVLDRGPVLAQHDTYGICLVCPLTVEQLRAMEEADSHSNVA